MARIIIAVFVILLLLLQTRAVEQVEVNLDGAGLGNISADTFFWPNVTKLHLENNNISGIDSFPILPNITWLDIGQNNLEDFPNLVNVSGTLEVLILVSNSISHIEQGRLEVMTHVYHLNLNRNKLTTLPEVSLPELKRLQISNNDLSSCQAFETFSPNVEILNSY